MTDRRHILSRLPLLLLILLVGSSAAAAALPPLEEVRIPSSIDGTPQPCRVWVPPQAAEQPVPVLVFLHSWSSDYRQDNGKWFDHAVERNWIYFHPNFRGRNDNPQACGSRLAQQDILDGLDWVIANYRVDTARIYLAGTSGGGHMAMLMAGRHAERFSAVSAWVGISDLAQWHHFHSREGEPSRYAKETAAACGGVPGESEAIDAQYRARSPIHWLAGVGDLPLDLNAGVTDGKTGSVPFLHSLRAFNEVARTGQYGEVTAAEMDQLWQTGALENPQPADTAEDSTYGRAIHLRRYAGPARVTIFAGGHESLPYAAAEWLGEQRRQTVTPRPAPEAP